MKKYLIDDNEIQGGYYKEDLAPVKLAFFIAGAFSGFILGLFILVMYLIK